MFLTLKGSVYLFKIDFINEFVINFIMPCIF